ncbi:hypothetical protein TNCV_5099831 [Trichonephila clavipes]|uniref:Uncharacterized protein n=1 Tax=Trichonephila clavipes TaxID=2585209 RepID=A0A8X6V2G0_TRICX|nr:hypothetical protein TNCV_5099831 [Trichonephila clavipes]
MRTWRNLGGRAKLASFLVDELVTLATILASLVAMLVSSEPSEIFWKLMDPSTNVKLMTRAVIFLEVSVTPINKDARWYCDESDFIQGLVKIVLTSD